MMLPKVTGPSRLVLPDWSFPTGPSRLVLPDWSFPNRVEKEGEIQDLCVDF